MDRETESEALRWKAETDAAVSEVKALEKELETLRQRQQSLRAKAEARREQFGAEVLKQAAQLTADVTQVRLTMHEEIARSRVERRRLQEQLLSQQKAEQQTAELLRSATTPMRRSIERAIAVLRTGLPLTKGAPSVSSTIDWLLALDEAISRLPRGEVSTQEDALRSCAAIMLQHWVRLSRSQRANTEQLAEEEELVKELHSTRGHSATLTKELKRLQRDVDVLQETLDLEELRSKIILDEQRWLVPRVAAVVQEADQADQLPPPPPGCKEGWPWEIPLGDLRPLAPRSARKY